MASSNNSTVDPPTFWRTLLGLNLIENGNSSLFGTEEASKRNRRKIGYVLVIVPLAVMFMTTASQLEDGGVINMVEIGLLLAALGGLALLSVGWSELCV